MRDVARLPVGERVPARHHDPVLLGQPPAREASLFPEHRRWCLRLHVEVCAVQRWVGAQVEVRGARGDPAAHDVVREDDGQRGRLIGHGVVWWCAPQSGLRLRAVCSRDDPVAAGRAAVGDTTRPRPRRRSATPNTAVGCHQLLHYVVAPAGRSWTS